MSMLPQGQRLESALPDLPDLLDDPHAYLSEAPLAIGPLSVHRLGMLFAIPGIVLLGWAIWLGNPCDERVLLGTGLLIGSSVWFYWSLRLRGHELVCYPDGVELVYLNTSIWAPWALFHHGEGEVRPFVPPSDSPAAGLTLPINPEALPYVELRRNGVAVAWGRQAVGPQWQYTANDEVVLPARYQIAAEDIGELLLVLGNRLGKELPRTPVVKPLEEIDVPPVVTQDAGGWITLPLTRLQLPPCCARCGGPQDVILGLRVLASGDRLMLWLGVSSFRHIELRVPMCEDCKAVIESQQNRATSLGLILGAVLGLGVGLGLAAWLGEGKEVLLALGGFAGLVMGLLIGSSLAAVLSRQLPVRIRSYSPARGLVTVRFENPLIANRVLEVSRLRDRGKR